MAEMVGVQNFLFGWVEGFINDHGGGGVAGEGKGRTKSRILVEKKQKNGVIRANLKRKNEARSRHRKKKARAITTLALRAQKTALQKCTFLIFKYVNDRSVVSPVIPPPRKKKTHTNSINEK